MNAVMKPLTGTNLVNAGKQAKAHIDAAERHSGKAEEQYKAAGAYLVEAKQSVKHGEWLPWLEKYGIATQTASLCMRIYGDPEILRETRERKAKHERDTRKKSVHGRNLRAVPSASDPIEEDCDDCNTDEERWQRSFRNMAGDATTARAYWTRQFGKWQEFEKPSDLLRLAKQVVREWEEIVVVLEK
jgi:hypothetical protein